MKSQCAAPIGRLVVLTKTGNARGLTTTGQPRHPSFKGVIEQSERPPMNDLFGPKA
jgi:hypothetical protein